MKKPIIWLLLAIILLVVIATGFFYIQNKNTTINTYPLKIGTTKDNFILRITTKGFVSTFYNGIKSDVPILVKIEIINHNKIIHIENFGNDGKYGFLGFRILKGDNKEYLAYGKALLYTDAEEEYSLLRIEDNANISKVSGNIYGWQNIVNPKIDEHTYQLIDNKYIVSAFWDYYFSITAYYEIDGDTVRFANREHEIKQDSISPISIKNGDTLMIYEKPDMSSASSSITLSENTQVKLISVRYLNNSNQIIHAKIGEKEGWIREEDLSLKLGISPAP